MQAHAALAAGEPSALLLPSLTLLQIVADLPPALTSSDVILVNPTHSTPSDALLSIPRAPLLSTRLVRFWDSKQCAMRNMGNSMSHGVRSLGPDPLQCLQCRMPRQQRRQPRKPRQQSRKQKGKLKKVLAPLTSSSRPRRKLMLRRCALFMYSYY